MYFRLEIHRFLDHRIRHHQKHRQEVKKDNDLFDQ